VIAALILAAGESSRMGRPKALLPDPDGRPFVARLVRTFAAAGITDVVIVAAGQRDAIAAALKADGFHVHPSIVTNPNPERGQLSSLLIGLDSVARPDLSAALVVPVDIPLVHASTVTQVVDTWKSARALIVRPAMGSRHGHPVLFDRAVFDELRAAPLSEGARAVVHAHAREVVDVPVTDEGCLIDVDTPADYDRLIRNAGGG
jgi:molybdenum cofactor cytidylyltransferase